MPIRDRILRRRAKFIAAAVTLSCGGTVGNPTDAAPGDAVVQDGSKKDGGSDGGADASEDVVMVDVADTGPQPCLAPM